MEVTSGTILIRASALYLFSLAMVRLSGKQSISQLSSMDFVVVTILGNLFGTVILGKASLLQGFVAFGTLTLLHMLACYAGSKNPFLQKLLSPPPTMLLQNGSVLREGLRQEWINMDTLESEMRLAGDDQLEEVKEARLEPQGQLSLLKNESSKPATKRDLGLPG